MTEVPGGRTCDIISNLPGDVINVILMCLPLQDAVRTSVLSRKWRYNWAKLPKLTLDHTLWKETKQNIFHEVCCMLCLIRSSPNLEEIEIKAFNDEEEDLCAQEFLEAQYYADIKLDRLRKIKLKQISGKMPEMKLIKLLLAKSPMLETMLIEPCTKHISTQILIDMMKQVAKYERASPRAEVIF
ncbi:hypothetical protein HAX54_041991 [Datura stramonium]|uniref:F-box domain-containing protein n=1 Tax=Datura stramonium TaxID=4076 RepID=A0ABS8VZY6_DATST|nr:hypothetical protein [Datura stramonium]